jgi:hypothetical protein
VDQDFFDLGMPGMAGDLRHGFGELNPTSAGERETIFGI